MMLMNERGIISAFIVGEHAWRLTDWVLFYSYDTMVFLGCRQSERRKGK